MAKELFYLRSMMAKLPARSLSFPRAFKKSSNPNKGKAISYACIPEAKFQDGQASDPKSVWFRV